MHLVSDLVLERFGRSFGCHFESFFMTKAISGADKLKNEKHQIQLLYTVFREGRASPDETKIEENPLSELSFFESRNRP